MKAQESVLQEIIALCEHAMEQGMLDDGDEEVPVDEEVPAEDDEDTAALKALKGV